MKYVGSKNRHAKELLNVMLPYRTKSQWWVEPFVGGFNMIDKVQGNRLANDSHYWLIELFKALQRGWLPPENVSEQLYNAARLNKFVFKPELVGYIGFALSYGGKWFGGYRRDSIGKRNYAAEAYKATLKQIPSLTGIVLENVTYNQLFIPSQSLIYADPPYANTLQYKDKFDSAKFWMWAEQMHQQGHTIFVSEYSAPPEWVEVWSKEVHNTLTKDTGSKRGIERLFKHV